MQHIGMRVYLTAMAMFVSSLLSHFNGPRDRAHHKAPS